jgi:predicted dithiol-disulfide oxidoreductase (DUF899 family)
LNAWSREVEARRALLAKEKAFTRLRDEISQERRDLPWVKIDKDGLTYTMAWLKLRDAYAV